MLIAGKCLSISSRQIIVGRAIDERALEEIDRLVQKQVRPMRTTIVPAHYRRLAVAALTRRLVAALFATSGSAQMPS